MLSDPVEPTGLPLLAKVDTLDRQDAALAEARRMQGFSARQASSGMRQPAMFTRTPEISLGTFLDFGS